MSFSTCDSSPPSPHRAPLPFSTAPSLTGCPELNLSITLSPAPKSSPTVRPNRKLKQSEQLKHNSHIQVRYGDPAVSVVAEPAVSSHSPCEQQLRGPCGGVTSVLKPPAAASTQDVGRLQRAELNTTLVLKTKLRSLQGCEFDSQRAVQETLQRSERTKTLISARAAEVVNVSRSQTLFRSLVSVDVQEDEVMKQLQLPLAPPSQSWGSRGSAGPSPLFFITSDLLRQKNLPPEEVLLGCRPRLSACPAPSTFDLYRRQQCWEATP